MKLTPDIIGEIKRSGKSDDFIDCPFCGDHSGHLGIHRNKKIFHCFKCNASGRMSDLGYNLKDFNSIVLRKLFETEALKTFLGPISLPEFCKPLGSEDRLPYTYIRNRGIAYSEIRHYQFHHCTKGLFANRIIVPIFYKGILKYFIGRTYINATPKYMNAAAPKDGLVFKSFSGKVMKAVITEGVIDAIKVARTCPSISLLGKVLSNRQLDIIRESCDMAIVMLDYDAKIEGFNIYNRIKRVIPCRIVFISKKDPGEMEDKEIKEVLNANL